METFHKLQERGKTIVLITHDPGIAAEADRAVTIRDGRIHDAHISHMRRIRYAEPSTAYPRFAYLLHRRKEQRHEHPRSCPRSPSLARGQQGTQPAHHPWHRHWHRSVIAMTSLIGGIQNSLVNSLGLNAARMVEIYSSQELTDSDVEKLRKLVPQIEQIGIVDSAYSEYKVGDKSYTVMAHGVDSDMLDAVGAASSLRDVSIHRQSLNQARAWRSSARRRRSALRQRTGRTGENHQGVQRRGADCRRD